MSKSYDKYYVKREPSTGDIMADGESPVLGECAKKDCRLEPRHVKLLNKGWQASGVYYKDSEKQIKEDNDKLLSEKQEKQDAKEKQDAQDAINVDYESLKAKNEELTKKLEAKQTVKSDARLALEKEADSLEINYRTDIGDEKLQERINEVKNK